MARHQRFGWTAIKSGGSHRGRRGLKNRRRVVTMTEPILVCGATGQIGSYLRAALDAAGMPWIGLSRQLGPAGADGQWRAADFERSASLGPALEGIRAVFLASSDHPRQDELEI